MYIGVRVGASVCTVVSAVTRVVIAYRRSVSDIKKRREKHRLFDFDTLPHTLTSATFNSEDGGGNIDGAVLRCCGSLMY